MFFMILLRTFWSTPLSATASSLASTDAQHELDRAVVEALDVLEHEHAVAHLVGELAVLLFEPFEDEAFGRAVGRVEDVDERLQPAGLREVRLLDDRRQLAFEDRLDLFDDLGRGAVHLRDAQRDVALQLFGERAQHHRAGVGVHVREHERDRLRVLVLEIGEHLAGVGAAQELERRRDHRDAEVVEDLVGLAAAEARFEQLARGGVAALGDVRRARCGSRRTR